MNLLSIKQLSYLHCGPISLEIKSQDCIGLSGVSGSGKSQFLRVLADMEVHQGSISLDAVNQQDVPAHQWRKMVAMLPAETVWWFDTVEEHFPVIDDENFEVYLHQLGFDKTVMQWSVSRLSSGEKQRLGLLRLLQNKPQVLLLDEPTANLDAENTKQFEGLVKQYLLQHQACVVWVSHDIDQLQRISTAHYQIIEGVLVLC